MIIRTVEEKFKKSDIIISLFIGEVTAWLLILIGKNIQVKLTYLKFLPIILPFLFLFGLYFTYLISKKFRVFYQIGKFVLVGGFNTMVDFGVLNLLILLTGLATGISYSIFKSASFLTAAVNSYLWNKFWTFKKTSFNPVTATAGEEMGKEFLKFLTISFVGFMINVGVASFLVIFVGPLRGISPVIWANLGAVAGTAFSMTWNFLGYKFIVFK